MKKNDITPGRLYTDGKLGLRQIISIDDDTASYVLLAAKADKEYCWKQEATVSLLDKTYTCQLASFATWAKQAIPIAHESIVLCVNGAARVHLTKGERDLLAEHDNLVFSSSQFITRKIRLCNKKTASLCEKDLLFPTIDGEWVNFTNTGIGALILLRAAKPGTARPTFENIMNVIDAI